MGEYDVADAKTHLSPLTDEALDGEAIVLTRHGKPVAELHPVGAPNKAAPYHYERLWRLVRSWPSVGMT
jgi:prevent-host-death family protein